MTAQLNLPVGQTAQYRIISDPAGNFLFISSSGANPGASLFVYAINSSTGALTPVPGSPFASQFFNPGTITTDGLGRFLYVCNDTTHGGSSFEGYTIAANGALALIPGGPFAGNVWDLQGDASGRYLIGTSGDSKAYTGIDNFSLYVFSINQSTGAATPAAGSPVATVYSPFTIAVQPPSSNGEFVYSFSINDTGTGYNGIEGYQLDSSTGKLTAITGSPFNNLFLGFWGQFDQSGQNLLVYSSVIGPSGTQTQIGPLSVSSSGALTQPNSTLTLVTPGWWVVTNP